MTRKVDTYEYANLETCIQTEQVPSEIAELFTDKKLFISGIVKEILYDYKLFET